MESKHLLQVSRAYVGARSAARQPQQPEQRVCRHAARDAQACRLGGRHRVRRFYRVANRGCPLRGR
eukprot:2406532-Prymnesium_polylepis.1